MIFKYKGQTIGGSSGAGGVVNWEDINGKPDLSNVSSMKTAPIVLSSDLWDESNQQTVPIIGVLADEDQQLIIPVPKKASKNAYISCGIECVDQNENSITFECKTIPEDDISVNVFTFEAAEVGEEYSGEFVWWSPEMTSDNTPDPYVVSSSSVHSSSYSPWKAFDANFNTDWVSLNDSQNNGSWLMFDFGSPTIVKGLRISPQSSRLNSFPHSGIIEGSNDGITWTELESFSDLPIPTAYEFREHLFEKPVAYRYYRLSHLQNSYYGMSYTGISECEFYKLEEPT